MRSKSLRLFLFSDLKQISVKVTQDIAHKEEMSLVSIPRLDLGVHWGRSESIV